MAVPAPRRGAADATPPCPHSARSLLAEPAHGAQPAAADAAPPRPLGLGAGPLPARRHTPPPRLPFLALALLAAALPLCAARRAIVLTQYSVPSSACVWRIVRGCPRLPPPLTPGTPVGLIGVFYSRLNHPGVDSACRGGERARRPLARLPVIARSSSDAIAASVRAVFLTTHSYTDANKVESMMGHTPAQQEFFRALNVTVVAVGENETAHHASLRANYRHMSGQGVVYEARAARRATAEGLPHAHKRRPQAAPVPPPPPPRGSRARARAALLHGALRVRAARCEAVRFERHHDV